MLSEMFFACLLAIAYGATPQFVFRRGQCPEVPSSADFSPSMLYDHKWKMIVHSDPNQHQAGCCTCVSVRYFRESDEAFTSVRKGSTTDGQMEFKSHLNKIDGDNFNRYLFRYRDGEMWRDTGMKTSFYFHPNDSNNFMAYGCVNRLTDNHFADIVLMMTKDDSMSESKISDFKQYLSDKSAGQPNYYTVAHAGCPE